MAIKKLSNSNKKNQNVGDQRLRELEELVNNGPSGGGKVDDVKVNGVSVLSGKTANITVPTKVSDLENDADYATQQDVEDSAISEVEATIDDNVGTPDVDVTLTGNKLTLAFQNILGDGIASIQQTTTSQESEGINILTVTTVGGKVCTFQIRNGAKGDTVILGEGIEYTLYNGTGQNTDGAMTQKAVTDAISEVIYDISAANSGATYLSLSAALGNNGANVPSAKRKGGMSIKFIKLTPATYSVVKADGISTQPSGTALTESSSVNDGIYTASQLSDFSTLPANVNDTSVYYIAISENETTTYTTWTLKKLTNDVNTYEYYRYLSDSTTNANITNVTNWQGIDDVPTTKVNNLISSSGMAEISEALGLLTGTNRFRFYYAGSGEHSAAADLARISIKNGDTVTFKFTPITGVYNGSVSGASIRAQFFKADGTRLTTTAIVQPYVENTFTVNYDDVAFIGVYFYKGSKGVYELSYSVKSLQERVEENEIKGWIIGESFTVTSASYTDGVINSPVSVSWPDGKTGTLTLTRNTDGLLTKIVATHGSDSYTLTITRNSDGNVTATSIN